MLLEIEKGIKIPGRIGFPKGARSPRNYVIEDNYKLREEICSVFPSMVVGDSVLYPKNVSALAIARASHAWGLGSLTWEGALCKENDGRTRFWRVERKETRHYHGWLPARRA